MFIVCEELEDGLQAPVINEFGYVTQFQDELEADIERIYLQPDYQNKLIVIGG